MNFLHSRVVVAKPRWLSQTLWRTLGVFLVVLLSSPSFGCPNCKDALAENSGSGNIAYGFGWSIIFMLSMPYTILGAIGTYFYLLVRRARRANPVAIPSAEPSAMD